MRLSTRVLFIAAAACVLVSAAAVLTVADTPTSAKTSNGQSISWKEHLIDDQQIAGGLELRGGDGLKTADLDGDGHLDIVSVHEDSHHIRIAFGTADPDKWINVTLAEGDEAKAAEDVAIADANGDGHADVIVACELAHLIYFQNPGGAKARTGNWPRTVPEVTKGRGSWIRVFFADLDGDGRPEVVAANKGEQSPVFRPGVSAAEDRREKREISWFSLTANPLDGARWREHVLTRVVVPINAQPVDIDGDGDVDIVGGSAGEGRIVLFENVRERGGAVAFREHPIRVAGRTRPVCRGHKCLGGMHMIFEDLSGDGKKDIVLNEDANTIVWLAQPPTFSEPWQLHVIGEMAPDNPTGITLVDIDGDGRKDLIAGGYSQNPRDHDGENITAASTCGRISWFQQPPAQQTTWVRHDVVRRKRGMFDEFVPVDLDRDGDVDFLATRGNSGNYDGVFWLEQVRTPEPRAAFSPARHIESEHVPLPPAATARATP